MKPNTKENAKYKCMLDNDVKIIPSCELLDFINTVFAKNISIDKIVKHILERKTSASCLFLNKFIFKNKILKTQINEKQLFDTINNVLKHIKKYLMRGVEHAFCRDFISALLNDKTFNPQ